MREHNVLNMMVGVVASACSISMIALAIHWLRMDPVISSPLPVKYFNVALDTDLQDYIFLLCGQYNVDPALVIALIENKSGFDSSVTSYDRTCYGLMGVEARWQESRMMRLGATHLFDPYQNIRVGIDYLSELLVCDNGVEWALMAYDGGYNYADQMRENGIVSSGVEDILHRMRELQLEQ